MTISSWTLANNRAQFVRRESASTWRRGRFPSPAAPRGFLRYSLERSRPHPR